MKRISALILSFALAFAPSLAYASPGTIIKGDVLDGFENILVNPSYERATAASGWTSGTGATASPDTTNLAPGQGRQSVSLALSTVASATSVFYQDVTPIHQFGSTNMEAGLWVKTSTTGLQVCPRSGGTVLTAQCVSVPATGTWQPVSANLIGPSSGSVGVALYAPSSIASGTVNVDGGYLGRARNLSQVSQSQLLGSVVITGCSGAWQTTGTGFGAWTTIPTGCSYAVNGQAQAPAANTLGLTFASIPPGNLTIQYEGLWGNATTAARSNLQFWDGTNSALETSQSVSTGQLGQNGVSQSINYTTAQSNVTFSLRGLTTAGGTTQVFGTTSNPGVIKVYFYPSQSQLALRADTSPANWAGSMSGTGWSTASSSFADPAAGTSISLASDSNSSISGVVAASGSLPGITAPLPKPGNFRVCAYGTLTDTVSAAVVGVRLVDGSAGIVNASAGMSIPSANGWASYSLCGKYYSASGGATTFKIQLATTNSGTVALGSPFGASTIRWTIEDLDNPLAAPYIVGLLSTNTQGQERVERARVQITSSTCSITSQSGNWLSVSFNAGPYCSGTIAAGEFSAAPQCVAASDQSLNIGAVQVSSATSLPSIAVRLLASGNALATDSINIICVGPR